MQRKFWVSSRSIINTQAVLARILYHIIMCKSPQASAAYSLVSNLQSLFVQRLEQVSEDVDEAIKFQETVWLRDEGRHGGGSRFSSERDNAVFNGASVNVSHVHYNDDDTKGLGSATALSTIIHPANPHAASMHMHISWTEMKDSSGYWRIMADLNPSIAKPEQTKIFYNTLKDVTGEYYEEGAAQGDKYFYIPVLGRHRGVSHYYLEGFSSNDQDQDIKLAKSFGEAVIETYSDLLKSSLISHSEFSEEDKRSQLDYHTLYFLQVLTLDRGTTSGLLVNNQNDLGIMGSLPAYVDKALLISWLERMPLLQKELLEGLINIIPDVGVNRVTDQVRLSCARVVREFYKKNPEALKYQASGNVMPPTVKNHQ